MLLDNGRTRALADEVGRQALRCIRCSACLNVCPVYERVGGHAYGSVYPGPIGAILNPLLKGVGTDPQVDSLPYASTLCGACFEVCPVAHRHPRRSWCTCAPRSSTPTAATPCPRPRRSRCAPRRGGWPTPAGWVWANAPPAWPAGSAAAAAMPGGRRALSWLPWPGPRWTERPRPARCRRASRSAPGGADVGRDEGPAMSARDDVLAAVRAALAPSRP